MPKNDRSIPGALLVTVLLALGLAATAVLAWRRAAPGPQPIPDSADRATSARHWPVIRIDVNAATEAELTLLPGIGPGLAGRIVSDRERHGPFTTLDDLRRVSGIGPKTVEGLAELAVAGADSTLNSEPDAASADQEE